MTKKNKATKVLGNYSLEGLVVGFMLGAWLMDLLYNLRDGFDPIGFIIGTIATVVGILVVLFVVSPRQSVNKPKHSQRNKEQTGTKNA